MIFQADSPGGAVSLYDSYDVGRAGEELIDSFDDINALNDALSPIAQAIYEDTDFNYYMSAINGEAAELIARNSNVFGGQEAYVYKVGDKYIAHTDHVDCNQEVTDTLRVLDADEVRQVEDGVDLFELINGESVEVRIHM